jgi:hypothetical protein
MGFASRRQAGVNQVMPFRLKDMWSDVITVLRIPTFQILILQGIVYISYYRLTPNSLSFPAFSCLLHSKEGNVWREMQGLQ